MKRNIVVFLSDYGYVSLKYKAILRVGMGMKCSIRRIGTLDTAD